MLFVQVELMSAAHVLILYNQPLLPKDHQDAESEHSVVQIAEHLVQILQHANYRATLFGLALSELAHQ